MIGRIIVLVIFGGFGVVLLYVGLTQFLQQRRLLANAERVDATITHAEVFSSTSSDTDSRVGSSNSTTTHRPDVRFRYRLHGHEYESDLLYPNIIVTSFASRNEAADVLAPFPVGAKVRAFVDPTLPGKAFLVASSGNGPVVFMILGILLPPLAWFVGRWV